VLGGKKSARREVALHNAAAGIYVGGLAGSLQDAVGLADDSIASGRALSKLDQLIEYSRKLA